MAIFGRVDGVDGVDRRHGGLLPGVPPTSRFARGRAARLRVIYGGTRRAVAAPSHRTGG